MDISSIGDETTMGRTTCPLSSGMRIWDICKSSEGYDNAKEERYSCVKKKR